MAHGEPSDLLVIDPGSPNLGWLYSSAEIILHTPNGTTSWVTMSFPIPNSIQLLGSNFYQQVASLTARCRGCMKYYYLSRGGHGVIGK